MATHRPRKSAPAKRRRRPVDGWKGCPKTKGFMAITPAAARVKVGQDMHGYFCFRGRERSISYPCQAMIPKMYIEFIADVYRKGKSRRPARSKRSAPKRTIR